MNVIGPGVPAGATVAGVTATSVRLSATSTAGVAAGASIMFRPGLAVDNPAVHAGQRITVVAFTLTEANA